jgi:5-methylcytosine-specific restriction protein A
VVIEPVERSVIEMALKKFDEELRESVEWLGWELRKAQRHAIEFDGRLYPPKKIISLATLMPVSQFSGGFQSNNYLTARDFKIIRLQSIVTKPLAQFQIGKIYDRKKDIHRLFGGSAQSGIAPSNIANAIFLFTGESGGQYGYNDKETLNAEGGSVFLYTGEGQVGDMEFTRGNRAVLEHSKDGRALHLFRSLGKSRGQKYLGEFVYASHHLVTGSDRNGENRKLIIFDLVPIQQAEFWENLDDTDDGPDAQPPITLSKARSLAIAAAKEEEGKPGETANRRLYRRSKAVKDYVLLRANGLCEACKKPAPFIRNNGTPYLEPHHTTRVSDGGPDHPRHVGAICPACHREIHYGKDGATKNSYLQIFLLGLESEL